MTQSLPTGTVTFVFTDLEGSTALLRELGNEDYAALLAEHRRIVREAFEAHGGIEVDSQGDGFFFVFTAASEAAAAATDVQQAHATAAFRMRIGVHTGEPILTDSGYVGLEVHHAARIAAAAHGGQVVMSDATKALVRDFPVRALGLHRLKDFPQRIALWQLGDGEFPPLRSLGRTALPVAAPVLYGRETDLMAIVDAIRSGLPLLTLTGPGGAGKTQLALHAARTLADDFDDGVFFVDLSPLREAHLVRSAIARALSLQENELDEALRRRQLIVLDNAEHLPDVGDVVAPFVGQGSVLLATSRAPLNVRFEQQLAVEPLTLESAVDLFLARAAAAGREVERDDVVRSICERLDNLPLAVELAAARVTHVLPNELLARLDGSLDALGGGPRDAPDRQRTLRNAIDWTYELLAPSEQTVFAALSVFAGGWTLDAAEAVCGASLDELGALVEKHLVREVDAAGRFSMLETIKSYAHEMLDEPTVCERHVRWFAEFAETAAAEINAADPAAPLKRLDAEIDNLRAALSWSRDHDPPTMARMTLALVRFWMSRGLLDEARGWLAAVLATIDVESERGAEVLREAGTFARYAGDRDAAAAFYEHGLRTAEAVEAPQLVARFLMLLGQAELLAGRLDSAEERLLRASTLQQEVHDTIGASLSAVSMGVIELERGRPELAGEHLAAGTAGLRSEGDQISLAVVLALAGYAEALNHRTAAARAMWREALELATGLGIWPTAAWALLVAAYVEADVAALEAAHWVAAAEAAYAEQRWTWEPMELRVRDDAVAAIRAQLDDERWQAAHVSPGLDHAIGEALSFPARPLAEQPTA